MVDKHDKFDFSALVASIRQTREYMAAQAGRAVNISLTLKNWVIGRYIREYEQNGSDRATYGKNLLASLAKQLENAGVDGCASRYLRLYRQFYLTYPKIWQTVSAKFQQGLLPDLIWQTVSAKFAKSISTRIRKSAPAELQLPPERLVKSLSFSHFVELIPIEDDLKRTLYEVEFY